MSKPEIRQSQLITTFGPGSMLDLPQYSVLVGGLDFWNFRQGGDIITETRLASKVRNVLQKEQVELRAPPQKNETFEERERLVTVFQFPEYFVTQDTLPNNLPYHARSRRLVHRHALAKGRTWKDEDRQNRTVVPIRFVRACPKGHIGDINWKEFVHHGPSTCSRELWIDEVGTSGDLSDVWIRCGCNARRRVSEASQIETLALGRCDGNRPWLGVYSREDCNQPNRLLIRTASNSYFPQILSVISIPEPVDEAVLAVDELWEKGLSNVQSQEALAFFRQFNASGAQRLSSFDDARVWEAIQSKRNNGLTSTNITIKELEMQTLNSVSDELGTDTPHGDFFARSLPEKEWKSDLTRAVSRVVLVHRLREVSALVGFTRFEAMSPDVNGELDLDVQRAALGLNVDWVPAYENRGEGVFLSFNPDAIHRWLANEAVIRRGRALQEGFQHWLNEHPNSRRTFPGVPYYLLHSLSHILISAVSLECGYPASSIKERIYCSPNAYGILLYTSSPDAEGTLGGLVETGRALREHLRNALDYIKLCSNDPVCSQHEMESAHDTRYLVGAACHGCLLISETSCEQHNNFLDRALVVPTLETTDAAFFGA
ncbi:DUF1998 domain-containing protein [Oligoflexus tunisiensis]|uniref:DUF1998 domain-containing protein n=1 Tax=Oligoflexus tunisiensis TaxID=708132 RepID=UPI000AFC0ABC|nr:DUF1998 domain-containing protein [Oligoflexus tunisiensis]